MNHQKLEPLPPELLERARSARRVLVLTKAQRVLAAVDLVHTPQLGSPAGPDFQMHWWQNIRPGTWRMWPLPWPGRKDRAGWLSLLTSFLLMLLIASVAVLLAILVF